LGGDVRPHHRVGGDRQSRASDPCAGSVRGDGSHCRQLNGIPLFSQRTVKHVTGKRDLKVENPFSLIAAAKFGVLFAVILLVTKFVQAHFPPSLRGRRLAGLTDVDAITLSMSEFAQTGEARGAVIAIVIAALSNTLVKCGKAFVLAGPTLGKPLAVATAATLVLGLAAAFFL
jgi:uncharacterized membrane protein (DUF4010 family)